MSPAFSKNSTFAAAALTVSGVFLSSCKEQKSEIAPAAPASPARHASASAKAPVPPPNPAPAAQPSEVDGHQVVAGAVLPNVGKTGAFPSSWEGRNAAQEEKRLRDSGEWDAGRTEFFRTWGMVDPASAIEASRSTDRIALTASTCAAVTGWASVDGAAARKWIDSQPVNAERSLYVRALFDNVKTDSEKTPEWKDLSSWMGGQLQLPGIHPLVGEYVELWSQQDRDSALAWTKDQIQDPALRAQVLDSVIQRSAYDGGDSFDQTAQWLQTYEAGPFKDELVFAFVKQSIQYDPKISADWAGTITDEKLRENALALCKQAQESSPR